MSLSARVSVDSFGFYVSFSFLFPLIFYLNIFTFTKTAVMRSGRFVSHCVSNSVCMLDKCESNRSISLKLGVMVGPTSRKN